MGTPLAGQDGSLWTSVTSVNLFLTNGSFELGTMGSWTDSGTVGSVQVYDGKYSCYLANSETLTRQTAGASVAANDVIMVRCWGYVTASDPVLTLEFQTAAHASLGTITATMGGAAWKAYTVVMKAPATTDHIMVSVACDAGDTCYVDRFEVFKLEQVGGFHNWTVNPSFDSLETTAFEDDCWKDYIDNIMGWTGTAERYWQSHAMFNHLNMADPILPIACLFYTWQDDVANDMTGYYLCGMAYVSTASPSTAFDSLVNETITFTGTGPISIHSN